MSATGDLVVEPGGRLTGSVMVPGDKSISHRAVMLSAIADGDSSIVGCLLGEDVRATIAAFRTLGVDIEIIDESTGNGALRVHGVGVDGLAPPRHSIDLGNSGTSMRLITGVLAGAGVAAKLIGDASLSARPMRRVADPLARMGARVETTAAGTPPVVIRPGAPLSAIEFELPVASAQVKSAVLLAGVFARGHTVVIEPVPTRDHTERMLEAFGVRIERSGLRVELAGPQRLRGTALTVPGDISSAAFFLVGAAISGATVVLPGVGVNPTRIGVIEVLERMGARIECRNSRQMGGEPVADIHLAAAALKGIEVPPAYVPRTIDELPALFIAAACAEGTTVLHGAQELRHKESDRIATMANGLRALGAVVTTFDDGIEIVGGPLAGGCVDACGDHRVAMSFAIAALRTSAPVTISNCAAIATSFPNFLPLAAALGLRVAGPYPT